ncbi:MAG: efflux RND transporter permease subunit [Aeromonadaceae bacterium]|nr:efflux RND transporter permease subunit [Aeromonadaceae bacterium]
MLRFLIRWSLHNPFLIVAMTLLIMAVGGYALWRTPLDAIPDLSDVQVIVYTEYPGQAPQVVEDQVTYPLTSALLSVPHAKVVRGFSFFGVSFVYLIFDEGTDLYWARSRVLEYLSGISGKLPAAVAPTLGPDATGVGWVYQYALVADGMAKGQTLQSLRALQDWTLRYPLAATPGVAEVASVGGFVKQYQVVVDPRKLQAYNLSPLMVMEVIRDNNQDVGGRVIELAETEFMVRGKGYLRSLDDLRNLVIREVNGVPVRIQDVARVEATADERRGLTELDGKGEVVSGIVVARSGENALQVIERAKDKLASLQQALPDGVKLVTTYDRSALIERAIATLKRTLLEESGIVALVCALFLLHLRSALVAILVLPVGVLAAFIAMRGLGVNANIMSLGGIAIAIGAMVDAGIVMVENAHKHLERAEPGTPRREIMLAACLEVGPALFFSLLIITLSFLPVFTLEAQEGRMFAPLALTKTFAMASAALLSVTLVPVLMLGFIRGKIIAEQANPLNRWLIALYKPLIHLVLRARWATIAIALLLLGATLYPLRHIGSEFMPTLHEGSLLFMPTALPGMSITKAAELVQLQNRIIKQFPEVESVLGKAGRANSATDPAPLEMFETVVNLKPESAWRPGMTQEKLVDELDLAVKLPGIANSWTMPIRARIDMLATGIRTPVGIKVFGPELAGIEQMAREIEQVVKGLPGTRSAYAERITGGYYLTLNPDRQALARYGVSIATLQQVIATALGGESVTTTVEGRERYGVAMRYPRELRDTPQAIAREVLVPTGSNGLIPLGELASLRLEQGPPSIRTENAQLVGYLYVDVAGEDIGGWVTQAKAAVAQAMAQGKVQVKPGYHLAWSGQFEYMERAKARLLVVVPLTLALIFLLLYLNFRNLTDSLIVLLSVPFALIGGVWLLWWLGYAWSVAVAVGFIALAGVAAETGVVMLVYLEQAWAQVCAERQAQGQALSRADLYAAILHGAAERVRPKMMTVVTVIVGLLPIMWGTGTGSEVMRRIAAPMVGGMLSSTLLTLLVIPVIYALVKARQHHLR